MSSCRPHLLPSFTGQLSIEVSGSTAWRVTHRLPRSVTSAQRHRQTSWRSWQSGLFPGSVALVSLCVRFMSVFPPVFLCSSAAWLFSPHLCSVWFISPALSPEFFLPHHTCTSPPSLSLFVLKPVLFPHSLFLRLFSSHPHVTPVILRSFVLSFASFLLPVCLLIIFWILWINEQLSLKLALVFWISRPFVCIQVLFLPAWQFDKALEGSTVKWQWLSNLKPMTIGQYSLWAIQTLSWWSHLYTPSDTSIMPWNKVVLLCVFLSQ